MKQADIQIGGRYLTYIGQSLCPVVVVRLADPGYFDKRSRFVVRRENETTPLPKSRTAAALRSP
jgi:hypothetical protein